MMKLQKIVGTGIVLYEAGFWNWDILYKTPPIWLASDNGLLIRME